MQEKELQNTNHKVNISLISQHKQQFKELANVMLPLTDNY